MNQPTRVWHASCLCGAAMRWRHSVFSIAIASSLGCDHVLAKHNPCGGFYPADGVAEISGVGASGDMDVTTAGTATTYAFNADPAVALDAGEWQCDTFIGGLAKEDGSETTNFQVSCGDATISLTLPDVRMLEQGASVTIRGAVLLPTGATCVASTGTLTITQATGSKASPPSFVTADFMRIGTIVFGATTVEDDAGLA